MRLKVKIGGLKPLLNQIGAIEDKKVRTSTLRKVVRAGVSEINKTARKLVQTQTKALKKSLAVKVKVYRKSGVVVGIVGPRTKFSVQAQGKTKKPSKYAHFAHDGRASKGPKIIRRIRRKLGFTRGSRFLAKAAKQAAGRAKTAMEAKAAAELKAAWKFTDG